MLDFNMLGSLCRQIAAIHEKGWRPVLVTSGAVASGRGFLLEQRGGAKKVQVSSRTYAALGQSRLLAFYTDMLEMHNVPLRSAQILLTREAFSIRDRYTILRDTLFEMLEADILPIVNNNDVLDVPRLDFRDNDHLAAYVAGMLDAEILVLLSDIDGLYTHNPKLNQEAQKIQRLTGDPLKWPHIRIDDSGSSAGGMKSKLAALKLMASLGIACCIAHGRTEDALVRILVENDHSIGTYLEPRREAQMDTYQRWLATGALPVGTIVVSNLGSDALKRREHRASLLAAGVEAIYGKFDRDAIVAIRDDTFDLLGVGRAKYSSAQLRAHGWKASDLTVVHANYFLGVTENVFPDNTEKSAIQSSVARWRQLGFTGVRRREGNIIILHRPAPSAHPEEVRRITGIEARALSSQAKLASTKIGVSGDDWILYALLERDDMVTREATPLKE